MNTRYKIFIVFLTIVWIVILLRLFIVNIINGEYYKKSNENNTTKTEVLVPMRGQIFDRNNEPLAINNIGFSIALNPKIRNKEILESQIEFITSYLPHLDSKELYETYKKNDDKYNHLPVEIVSFVPYLEMFKIYAFLKQSPYIAITTKSTRLYPYKESASHVIGYVAKANNEDMLKNPLSKYSKVIGKNGIEKQYNSYLQGIEGYRKTQINALYKEVKVLQEDDNLKRNDLRLTLDIKLQTHIDKEFIDKSGAIVVMDVHNGEILAAGSYPEYNINYFVDGISHKNWNELLDNVHKPLINRLVNGYPPGSVVKMGTLLSILEFAGIDEYRVIKTPPFLELSGNKFRDWKKTGHGSADAFKSLRESVDVYYYILSQKVGIENMSSVLRQLGFGNLTGVDIPIEYKGVLPTPEFKFRKHNESWYIGDTAQTSIGQGFFLATPMQIVRYTALVASGKLVTPHFAKDFNGETPTFPIEDVLSDFQKSKLNVLRKGMHQVCSTPGGTAYIRAQGSRVSLACKTGTAQVTKIPQDIAVRLKTSETPYFLRDHAWITAFVPYENPKYAITILLEHGGGGGNGAPILVKIANELKRLGYI